jgi:hypothetical protein
MIDKMNFVIQSKMYKKIICIVFFYLLLFNACHPPFDPGKPDTKNNQFHYEHLLNVEITPDIKSLYAYGDEFGIDASYYLSFECEKETVTKIVEQNRLTHRVGPGSGWTKGPELRWWDKTEIDTLEGYMYKNDSEEHFKYLWYNESNHHAYFLDFDL